MPDHLTDARGAPPVDVGQIRAGLGEPDARGMTAIEDEFVGGRLTTGAIAAQCGLPDALWAIRYTQDVPRLLREVRRLRAELDRLRQAKVETDERLRRAELSYATAFMEGRREGERKSDALQRRLAALTEAARAVIDHDCQHCVTSWCDERDDRLLSVLNLALDADAQEQGEAG